MNKEMLIDMIPFIILFISFIFFAVLISYTIEESVQYEKDNCNFVVNTSCDDLISIYMDDKCTMSQKTYNLIELKGCRI